MSGQAADRERLLDKLAKMMRQRDGEAAIGNVAAAEAFAEALNRMMLKHQIAAVEVELAAGEEAPQEPVKKVYYEPEVHGSRRKRARSAWAEELAEQVAKAHLCRLLVLPGSNSVCFFGVESHAVCAEYSFGTLAAAAERMSWQETVRYYREKGRSGGTGGFQASWLSAFVARIAERLRESRRSAVREGALERGITESAALVLVDNAAKRVAREFEGLRTGRASAVYGRGSGANDEGARRGRAAADRVPIGRRGVSGGNGPAGELGS